MSLLPPLACGDRAGVSKSAEGCAPLRRVDMRAGLPDGIELSRRVMITPTFVLVDNGREVGRVAGYAGAEFFYDVLNEVMQRPSPQSTVAK